MRTLFVVLALFAAVPAFATTQVGQNAAQFKLNKASPAAMSETRLGDKVIAETVHILRAKYDFTLQGGAIGTIVLKDVSTGQPAGLPKGAIVSDCAIDVITAPTSGGSATISFSTGKTAADLKAATAIASVTGLVACIPVGTVGTSIKLTADSTMSIAVATAALTAGKFYVIVRYVNSSGT